MPCNTKSPTGHVTEKFCYRKQIGIIIQVLTNTISMWIDFTYLEKVCQFYFKILPTMTKLHSSQDLLMLHLTIALWAKDPDLTCKTPSRCPRQLCQVISKYLQKQLNYTKENISKSNFWPLTSICDLDLGVTNLSVAPDTPSQCL